MSPLAKAPQLTAKTHRGCWTMRCSSGCLGSQMLIMARSVPQALTHQGYAADPMRFCGGPKLPKGPGGPLLHLQALFAPLTAGSSGWHPCF